jgi:hypothetical protein
MSVRNVRDCESQPPEFIIRVVTPIGIHELGIRLIETIIMRMWSGFNWLRTGYTGGIMRTVK